VSAILARPPGSGRIGLVNDRASPGCGGRSQAGERPAADRAARRPDRQTASAEILRTIAGTSGDAKRPLQQIAETTARLFGASSVTVLIADGHEWGQTIRVGVGSKQVGTVVPANQFNTRSRNLPGTVFRENRQIHIPDLHNLDPAIADWPGLPPARAAGTHVMAGTPLRREAKAIGALIVYRDRPEPFTAEELALLQSFADQAVIAIENARLFNETREALDRQTATAEILKVIASSPSDVQPVFEAIASSANRLLGGFSTAVFRFVDDVAHLAAFTPTNPAADELLRTSFPLPLTAYAPLRLVQNGEAVQFADTETAPDFQAKIARARRFRSILLTPLMSNGAAIGLISVTRVETGSFADHHVQLLQTFADQAVIAIENVRLFNETREALDRQTATAEILKVIASSPSDVQPVFDVIVERAVRLCGGRMGRVYRYGDGVIQMVAGHGLSAPGLGKVQQVFPRPATDDTIVGQVMLSRRPYILADIKSDKSVPALSRQMIEALGTRSQVTMPMLLAGEPIGAITVGWADPGAYKDQQITLLQTFADQAVIAIENVRLFNETREALERQTATADILKVIASSPSDVQPVFDAIASSSKRLIGCFSTAVFRLVGDSIHLAALTSSNPAGDEALKASFPQRLAGSPLELVRGGEAAQIVDTESEPAVRDLARLRGYRSLLFTPLMSNGAPIGMISVTRKEPGSFAAHHVQLLQTFADQAVIAIENVRLFEQVQAKTRDLTESLQQQTATADVLKVISRSAFDLDTVMNTLSRSASELCEADLSALFLRDGNLLVARGVSDIEGKLVDFVRQTPVQIDDETYLGRAVLRGSIANIPDFEKDTNTKLRTFQKALGFKSILMVPLMREGRGVGVFALCRNYISVFSQRQIELVQTFADQAVIAIENVRLFDEVQAKTRDLSEALTYQTGSSNILSVIASSPTDVGPVLKAIVESACELCDANDAIVHLREGDYLRYRAHHGPIPFGFEKLPTSDGPIPFGIEKLPINRDWITGRSVVDKVPVHVHDVLSDEGADFPEAQRLSRREGTRTLLSVPLVREGESIGAIVLRRTEVNPFSEKQIALLQTFADQAVIALGNVRMFEQVQEGTEDLHESLQFQTATSDVLKVISSSPDSLQPVLDVIVDTSRHLCGTETSTIFLLRDERFHIAAASGAMPEYLEFLRNNPIALDQAGSSTSRAAREKRTVHVPDISADPEFGQGPMAVGQRRALLSVPLMREGTAIGVITMRQSHLTPFSERQIEVVQTFADQAVIAISNVRLFEEVQQRTQELSKSLDELRTAQDRLVQTEKLASLGQLTAGIAHEIKNPLNFVNNFSALSAELTDELNDVLKSATLSDKIREEIDELTGLLKDNLEKVVQHGKRADSIVKNMLLHSREGSGDHRPADINALLDESLNLAYHGARAEKREFNVTLQRDFDEMAGTIEVFPQEITRVFLNLISNGF
jgi:GAF domain-containing protein